MVDSSQKSVAKCTTGKCRFSMFQDVCCKFYSWMMHWVGPTEILRKGKYSIDFWTCKVLVHYKVLEYLILEVVEFPCSFGELELQQLFEISLKVYDHFNLVTSFLISKHLINRHEADVCAKILFCLTSSFFSRFFTLWCLCHGIWSTKQ